ncbi:MAG: RNA-binding protein [Actinomycetia bacterium]|nr:RNA-binding protein [Actinomycetes bacterium]MCP4086460.1 RNA-binding protein [Actinomycetes bacterium]
MRLLVRNLARSTTEETLRALFAAYGPVQSCTIVMDAETKQSKGFGFVTMPKAGHAKAAVAELNRSILDGATIRVKKAAPVSGR